MKIVILLSIVGSSALAYKWLTNQMDWLQYRDKLSFKRGFRRYRYDLHIQFVDGRQGTWALYANYAHYLPQEVFDRLILGQTFFHLEEYGHYFSYRIDQIQQMVLEKVRVR